MDIKTIENSSNIKGIGYDPTTKTMRVVFNSGSYDYSDVEPEKHDEFLTVARDPDASTGAHFAANFKGQHEFSRVEE